ncbi:hypothetical protein GBA52_017252 [Prunus armeniaca]|nr:hypothetical protein GBA52_017252 [Prunus armeniaca]
MWIHSSGPLKSVGSIHFKGPRPSSTKGPSKEGPEEETEHAKKLGVAVRMEVLMKKEVIMGQSGLVLVEPDGGVAGDEEGNSAGATEGAGEGGILEKLLEKLHEIFGG